MRISRYLLEQNPREIGLLMEYTVSKVQYVSGSNKGIAHAQSGQKGVPISKAPISGPNLCQLPSKLPPLVAKYKVLRYFNDYKPVISSIEEFLIVIEGIALFEKISACCLHLDLKANKCKILLLGSWSYRRQEDIMTHFLKISRFLDML